jgi:hypothetical protein
MKFSRMGLLMAAGIVCFGMSAQAQQSQPAAKPAWIADSKTGCKVWNPAPQAHETIQWSGTCDGGYATGKGTVTWFENGKAGDRYVGEYQSGKRNGHGVVTMGNGTRIEGDWSNDILLQPGVNEI